MSHNTKLISIRKIEHSTIRRLKTAPISPIKSFHFKCISPPFRGYARLTADRFLSVICLEFNKVVFFWQKRFPKIYTMTITAFVAHNVPPNSLFSTPKRLTLSTHGQFHSIPEFLLAKVFDFQFQLALNSQVFHSTSCLKEKIWVNDDHRKSISAISH